MSFTVKMDGLKAIIAKLDSPELKDQIENVARHKGIAALIGQAIAENFAKEGPGWAPLKSQTIRSSLSKKQRRALKLLTGQEISMRERILKKSTRLYYENKILAAINKKAKLGKSMKSLEPSRAILQRSRLLYKTATIPGYSGSGKGGSGSNTYRVEGTNIYWGTSLIYAATHNKGAPERGIPQREFLLIRAEWMARINEFAVDRILQIFRDTILRGG